MISPILDVVDLKIYFYTKHGIVRAVDGVELRVDNGDFIGVVGESGCGKSTVGLSFLRLVPPPGKIVEGEIRFRGEDLVKKNESEMRRTRGREIAMIFQDPTSSLNPVLTIGDQIGETLRLHRNMSKSEAETEAVSILKNVGIPNPEKMVHQYPHQYSGGMKQRAMIAMALSCNPKLLIADEPTTNLDATIQAQILALLEDIRRRLNTTIVIITHNIGVIAESCNRVAVMYAGKIVEVGEALTVFRGPAHPYTKALLDSIPQVGAAKELVSIPGSVPDLISPPSGCRFHPRCQYASTECMTETPELVNIGDNHSTACFNYKELQ